MYATGFGRTPNFLMGYGIWPLLYWRAKDGALVRALASHQCGPGSNPGLDAICELRLLLVLSFSLRGFSPGTLVFPSPQRPTFSHVLSPNHIYLFIYLFTREARMTKILTWIRILYSNRSSGCGVVMWCCNLSGHLLRKSVGTWLLFR